MTKKKMGRPLKEINKEEFEKLCFIQCTLEEICGWYDVDDVTLNAWCKRTYGKTFSEVFKQKRQSGKISLRRNTWQMAQKSVPVAIFLCKNFLGMSDKNEPTAKDLKDEIIDLLESK